MDGFKIFEIYIDKNLVKRFSLETVNNYFIENELKTISSPIGAIEYWDEFWELLDRISLNERKEYTDQEFAQALETYRNQKITDSINSKNPIVRMFAVLDRRVGKRTLLDITDKAPQQPEWLKQFYDLRLLAEDI